MESPATVATAPAAPASATPLTAESVVAEIDGVSIRLAEVDREIPPETRARIAGEADVATRDDELARARHLALEALITRRLLVAEAERRRIAVADGEVDAALQDVVTSNGLSQAQLDRLLDEQGFTRDSYRQVLREQILVARLVMQQGKTATEQQIAAGLRTRAKISVVVALATPPPPRARPAAPAPAGHLDVSAVLVVGDLGTALKRPMPEFEEGRLAHDPDGATYASRHFRAVGKPETHDFAFRVWKLPAAELRPRYAEIFARLPGAVHADRIGDASFVVRDPTVSIRGYGFLDAKASVVVLLTCGAELCKTAGELEALAKLVHARLDRVR